MGHDPVFQDHFFQGLEDFVARRRAGADGGGGGLPGNSTDPMFS